MNPNGSEHTAPDVSEQLIHSSLVGTSTAFTSTIQCIQRFARSDACVLINGETGTGKELAARAIHYLGARCKHPFVPVNCGAIPDHLVENELFGHARGAYTDARDAARGVIEDADGGTLFLDEVEALSLKAQVALLRFLQDGHFRPLGGRQLMRANVRIVAASNMDLGQLVREGLFRADFMYRLRLLTVTMPPLRERLTDIVPLARHFLRELAVQYGRPEKSLDAAAIATLERYDWPGNVRELQNVIHREFLLSDDEVVRVRDSSFDLTQGQREAPARSSREISGLGFGVAKARVIEEFERSYLERALVQSGGNVSAAARTAGKERRAFGKLLKKYGIDRGVCVEASNC